MNELHIITPVSRPSNLPALYHDLIIQSAAIEKQLQINWWPVFDGNCGIQAHHWKVRLSRNHNAAFAINPIISSTENAEKGFVHRNTVLDILEENAEAIDIGNQWVYMLDDDNIMHQRFLQVITDEENQEYDVLVFGQERLNGITRYVATWESVDAGMVDLAMFTFKLKALKGHRFNMSNYKPGLQFVNAICNLNKATTKLLKENCSYYNFLR